MANLDSRFICTSDLELLLRDNASGLPLSGGIVTFYSDVNRTVLKPVYQLTGTPGNYSYTPLNNPCTLSSAGTFQDGLGNNIVPYYYPFTGTPSDNTGVQELYYIVVKNSGLVPQFTRQGWPQAAGSGVTPVSDNEIENFIPNGQFLSHNNIVSITEPPVTQYAFDTQTVDAQAIAQGGWYFVYTNANTATFTNSFSQIPASGGWGINSFPKFIFNFVCTSFNANALTRDLRIQWPDINKFSSGNPPGSVPYTLFFDARSNDTNSYTFSLYKIYYFGTGGTPSTPITTLVSTFTVGPSPTFVSQNIQDILFPANQGTIGTNGDDYIALSIRGPAGAWNVSFTDFALIQGNETLLSFPVDTNAKMLSQGVAGFMPTPNPDGSDLYLPLVLTPQGMTFDHSIVGTVVGKETSVAVNNELLCDGSSYVTSDYSSIGIPYSRLQAVLFNSAAKIPLFGTGSAFVQAQVSSGDPANIILCTNQSSTETNPSDGTLATGFNFSYTLPNLGTSGFTYTNSSNSGGKILFISNFTNGTNGGASFAAGTSTMVFQDIDSPANLGKHYYASTTALSASALAAGSATPGLYFTFSNHLTNYYVWFYINGETDPAPGGTGIRVNLNITQLPIDVANIIVCVTNGFQTNTFRCIAAASIPPGSWFQFFANSLKYIVWYEVNGSGTVPVVSGAQAYIKVVLTGGENNASVAEATQLAINKYSFAVPDLRGLFLRGVDTTQFWDLDYLNRTSKAGVLSPLLPGSFEEDQFANHYHPGSTFTYTSSNVGAGGTPVFGQAGAATQGVTVHVDGGSESRPVNSYVNWFIKY